MPRSAFVAFAALALAASLAAQKGIPEPRVGFEFKPPKGWVELPAGGDRGATLRLFANPRAMAAAKGEATHSPLMRVMFFAKGGDPAKDTVDGLPRATPFRSLEDFAQRGLGAKKVNREASKVATFDGQRVTGKDLPGALELHGQTVPLEDGEAAVCIEIAADQFDKFKKDVDGALGSLTAVPRTQVARIDPPWIADADFAKKAIAAKTAAHRKWADDVVAATTKEPEAGFKVQKTKYWTVLSASDPAVTKKVIAAAEAMRAWCQQKLPELTKEPPLPAILRVFDSTDHYTAFLSTRADKREYDQGRREVLFAYDRNNSGSTGYGPLFRAVMWHVFDDVDPGVLPALPRWFDNGIWEFLRSSHFDGKKLEFAQGETEKGRIEYDLKHEDLPPLWGFIQEKSQVSPEDGANEKEWGYTPECSRLMRWFWMHDGQKAVGRPNLVSDFVKELGAAFAEIGPDPTIDVSFTGVPEAQLKDLQKELNKRHYKWRDAVLVRTNEKAVPLTVTEWTAANEKWLAFVKSYKG